MTSGPRKKVVVVGLGMVGIAFIEKLLKLDARSREYEIVVIGEEPYLAYNRVGLTSFFSNRKIENLYLNPQDWYTSYAPENQLGCHVNTLVTSIDGENKNVTCSNGEVVSYDVLVLATGSDAVLPKHTPGYDATGVFVYRTIDDLQKLIAYGETKRGAVGAVVGGGLLGLEAAKAMMDLGCFAKIKLVERNEWVLSRQLDADAGGLVVEKVAGLGIDVLLSKRVGRVRVDEGNAVTGVVFEDGETMDCAAVCFAIGVRPRDQLARQAGLRCADRGGGIVVDDELRTSWPDVYAVGECASWKDQTFGLIAPGVEMADVLAFNLTQARLHRPRAFRRPDLSTKLKLLGVDVASFGDFFADRDGPAHLPGQAARERRKEKTEAEGKGADAVRAAVKGRPPPPVKALTYKDPFQHVYKKYLFTEDGKYLLGGMMIGDTSDYVKLVPMVKNQKPLEVPPAQLILGARKEGEEDDGADLDDDTQICSCHNVTKGDVVGRVKDGTCKSLGDVKACTKAGTGCGGCMPLVTTIFNATMKAMGNEVTNYVCAHFNHSRADLYHIVLAQRLTAFADVMRAAGNAPGSDGCEACKPVVASLFASLWNRHVLDRPVHGLQETNDRYLGNIQRDGTFSVVPRVSAGEITPDKLIVLGEVAQQYGLYTKITGGQRIDLFGARKTDLPAIWQRLVAAGMESGHAYAKSLRTVKSCVGSTWCRFGIGDSVGLAVRLEERYKSIRAPHKIKGGVSGCVRECAEAQSKDFGLIATDKGFNIFVCGNGGAKPRHADLLAKDVPPADVVPILDRFLMFYIRTADKLQRTARWLEQLPGGLRYLQAVVLDDKLGINASLEAQMQALVDSFFDEWAETVATPALAARFRQFANTDATTAGVETQRDRGQTRPVDWPRAAADDDFAGLRARWSTTAWQPVLEAAYFAGADDAPNGISATIRRGDTQLALFRVRGRYYCTQQMCPHKRAFALSDGLIGHPVPSATADDNDTAQTPTTKTESSTPYVSCPFHKRNYDLTTGGCSNDGALSIATFDVEERAADGMVYVKLPPVAELDAALGTARWRVTKADTAADPAPFAALDKKIAFKGLRAKKPGVRPLADVPTMRRPVELLPAAAAAAAGGCGGAPDW